MATLSPEDQIFFVYDHTYLQREEDDLKDAIVYFCPATINLDRQCSYCGQLMGLVGFFESFIDSPPSVYTLARNKFAVKRLGKFSLALAGSHMEPNSVILNQLEYLSNLLTFYQHSLQRIEAATASKSDMIASMTRIWDCYWPFVRRYGDNMHAAFEALPKVNLPKSFAPVFLQSSHLLQHCQHEPHVLAGCIIFKSKILLSQFDAQVTAKLLLIKPQQSNLPCIKIDLDFPCPQGVRLLSVHLTTDEYLRLCPQTVLVYEGQEDTQAVQSHLHPSEVEEIMRELTAECDHDGEESESRESVSKSEESKLQSQSEESKLESRSEESEAKLTMKSNSETKSESPDLEHGLERGTDCKTSLELKEELGQAIESDGNGELESIQACQVDRTDVTSVCDSDTISVQDSTADIKKLSTTSHQNSVHTNHTKEVTKEEESKDENSSQQQSQDPLTVPGSKGSLCSTEDFPSVEIHSSVVCNHSHSPDIKSSTSPSDGMEWKSVKKNPPKQLSFKSSDLFKNVQMAAARGTKALHRNHPINLSPEDDKTQAKSTGNVGYKANKGERTKNLNSTTVTANANKESSQQNPNILSSAQDTSDPQRSVSESPEKGDVVSPLSPNPCQSPTSPSIPSLSGSRENEGIKRTATVDSQGLVEADLYVQGHGDLAIILMMEKGKARQKDILRKMWTSNVTELGELDLRLKEGYKIKQTEMAKDAVQQQLSYNYLVFDQFAQSLEGEISLSGSELRPMSSREHHFCETSVKLHEEFHKHPSLTDVTLRHPCGSVYSKSSGVMEVFFQSCEPINTSGAPSEKDPTLNMEDRATRKLYRDQGLVLM